MKRYFSLAVSTLVLLTISQMALAKSTIGGIVFSNSFWNDTDGGANGDATKFVNELATNSRLRIRWSNEDNVGMYAEFAIRGDGNRVRHAYGTWDINETWQLLAGQTTTPFSPLNPNVAMVNNSGQSVGNTNPSRQSQIRLTRKFLNRKGALAISFSDPNGGAELNDAVTGGVLGTRETDVPRIDIGAAIRSFNWQVFPSVFFAEQSYTNLATIGSEDSVSSWGASLGLRRGFGPVVLAVEYGVGQNWGNTRMSLSGSPAGNNAGAFTFIQNGVSAIADTDNSGGWVDLGVRFAKGETKGSVHLVAGELNSEVDQLGGDYSSSMIGISAPIDLPWIARGLRIRPELFVFDNGNNKVPTTSGTESVDNGKRTIAGVQLQFTF